MSNSLQLCCTPLLTPYIAGMTNSYSCCNILTPQQAINSDVDTCSTVDCSSYTPTCFTPTSTNLCGYLAGIDLAICNLKTSVSSISCSSIVMPYANPNPYPCIPAWLQLGASGATLCNWATAVNDTFCAIEEALTRPSGGTTPVLVTPTGFYGFVAANLMADGGNGTFNGPNTTTGITATGATIASSNTFTHGNYANSLGVTFAATSGNINTTSNIAVLPGNVYEVTVYMYGNSGTAPVGAQVKLVVNGTGTSTPYKAVTVGVSNEGAWQRLKIRYTPDVAQNITVTINAIQTDNGKILYFNDLNVQPVTTTQSGAGYDYELVQESDLTSLYGAIASSFVISNVISNAGLNITLGSDKYIFAGKKVTTQQKTLTCIASNDNYVYYDVWLDTYVIKSVANGGSQPNTDDTYLLLYKVVTNGSNVTSTTNLFLSQPFNGTSIQPATITGAQIASNTVSDTNLTTTGVNAGTYGSSYQNVVMTVNAQGRVTNALQVPTYYPVTSVNNSLGMVNLGLNNLSNVVAPTPSAGQYLYFNGTNWVNTSAPVGYYQTVLSNISTSMTQRSNLNFTGYFTLTDDNINQCTTVSIAANGLTYDRIQKVTGAYSFLGNPTNASANVQEIGITTDLIISSSTLGINAVINKQTTSSYSLVATDVNNFTIVEMSNSGVRTATLPAANSVPVGRIVRIKDYNGNAGTNNIMVNVSGGGNIDGSSTYVISTNYASKSFYSDGVQWYSL